MTDLKTMKTPENTVCPPIRKESVETVKKVLRRALSYVPGLVIFGLIALYYIQLSHMAG